MSQLTKEKAENRAQQRRDDNKRSTAERTRTQDDAEESGG